MNIIPIKRTYEEELKSVLDETYEHGAYYIGGSLVVKVRDKDIIFHVNGNVMNGLFSDVKREPTKEENYLTAKIYLKNKTEDHHFFEEAKEIVKSYSDIL